MSDKLDEARLALGEALAAARTTLAQVRAKAQVTQPPSLEAATDDEVRRDDS